MSHAPWYVSQIKRERSFAHVRGVMPYSIQAKLAEAISVAKDRYHNLVVFVEHDEKMRTVLISDFAKAYGVDVINLNSHLSARLLEKSPKERVRELLEELRDIVDTDDPVVVLNHCEVLFDKALMNNPLKLLENISRNRTILAVWPGSYRNQSLVYATPGHPEYRCYENPEILIVSGHDSPK